MSFLARASLANRGLTALVALIVTAFGLFAIPSLKQQLFPSLDFPAAFVTASYPGAAPDVVESQVTEPIENAMQGIPGLKSVISTSREGLTSVQVEFEFGTDLDSAVNRLQTSLARAQAQLPQGVEPQVFAGSTDDFPAVVLAASSGGDERVLAEQLARVVVPALQGIKGVREATVTGARDVQLVIAPDLAKFAAAGVDPGAVATALRANGVAVPAGALTDGGSTYTVQVGTPLRTVADVQDLYLTPARGGAPVRLGDVATVTSQLAPATSITRTGGRPSLGISVTVTPDGNAVAVSHAVKDKLADLERQLGSGAKLTVVFDQAPFVEKSIHGLTTEGLLGLVMAVVVILVFLLSVRSTLVTAVAIPLSVIIALIALWAGDYSLNILTLGALTIAIGRVVDDSIVVLENIKRHLGYGEERREAILGAVKEVAGAVTASTLTTVAVFSPIALVGGLIGQLFASFAVTVTVALLASLLVALTVIPVLAYWFLKRPKPVPGMSMEAIRVRAEEKELRSPLQRAYVPVIRFATRRRWTTVAGALAVFLVTMCMGGLLKTNFFDQSGQNTLSINQKLPVGTSLATTDAAAAQVEKVLAGTPEITTYQVTVGNGGGIFGVGGSGANSASYSITLDPGADAAAVQRSLRTQLGALSGIGEIKVDQGGGGGFNASELQVIVKANDDANLKAAAEQVRAAMADTPDVADVTTDLASSVPRIQVTVKRDVAARYGLSDATVGQLVAAAMRGAPLGRYTLDGLPQTVVLAVGTPPATLDALKALPVATAAGPVRLDQVADVAQVAGPVQITRIDGNRSVTVSGTATGDNTGKTTQELTSRLKKLTLPAGASYTLGGVSSDQGDAFGSLGLALLAAIAIVYIIMAATFRSLVQPLILLVSIPFAATGAIGLLLATGTPLGVPALIGMLMLVGIVVTNAIVLLDLVNQYRAQGMGVVEAVVEGGRRRLRPILMTAIATIFALTPMALGLTGSGGFISQPLAIVVIGGLVSSTLLTLVLVPTLYTLVEGRRERRAAKRGAGGSAVPVETRSDDDLVPTRVAVG